MSPLNHLMNHSSEFAQSRYFFTSRILNTLCLPLEVAAIMENAIKLPFQAASFLVKIPATILNIALDSMSLREFKDCLSGPIDLLKTTLKIVGYAVGTFFTLSLGFISPSNNLKLHCVFGLTTNEQVKKQKLLEIEQRQKEIEDYEKIVEARLRKIVDALREQTCPVTPLTDDKLHEIETLTHVAAPSVQEIISETTPPEPVETENIVHQDIPDDPPQTSHEPPKVPDSPLHIDAEPFQAPETDPVDEADPTVEDAPVTEPDPIHETETDPVPDTDHVEPAPEKELTALSFYDNLPNR